MAKKRKVFVCRECGAEAPAWTGRCAGCGGWATVDQVSRQAVSAGSVAGQPTVPLNSFDAGMAIPWPVGLPEVDRVLGGGLVPGSVTLLSGEPGVGKSTLALQMACSVAAPGAVVVLVTGEEAPVQVAARAGRLGVVPPSLVVLDNTSVDSIVALMESTGPALVVVDSIQTLVVPDLEASPGSISQVRESAARLVSAAKRFDVSLVLIGHVTKDGTLAGPRLLEHVVDTVLSFTGDRHHDLRFLRSTKHRFGTTAEVGLFEMTGLGLAPVTDPSSRFLADRLVGEPGSIVVPALDGQRPVLVEIQALTAIHGDRPVNIQAEGVSQSRARLVAAVLEQRAAIPTFGFQLFLSAAGGASAGEPGVDLGIGLAIVSALRGHPFPPELVACGEVGLSGEIRAVPQMERRLQEAHRLGFRIAIVPASTSGGPTGLKLIRAATMSEALDGVRLWAT